MRRVCTEFDKLLELLSRSGSGIFLPGRPGKVSCPSTPSGPASASSANHRAPAVDSVGQSSVAGMSAEDWKLLLWEARRQRVSGLVAEAVAALPYEEQLPLAIRAKLTLELEFIKKKNIAVNVAARELLSTFEAEGFHPVIQKGPAVAALYPNPLHREPGDIDFYFPAGEFERSRVFVQSLSCDASLACGLDSALAEDCDAASRCAGSTSSSRGVVTAPIMESDGAFWYKYKGVTIEHHPVFYDCRCQFPSIDVKSPEAMLLMLSAHILKHALGKGIGLKQIIDYYVARRTLDYDPVLLEHLIAKAGLRKWQRLLDDFGPALRLIVAKEGNFGSMPSLPMSGKPSVPMSRKPVSLLQRLRTAAAFCRKIPFALRYSPREWLHTVILLSRGPR